MIDILLDTIRLLCEVLSIAIFLRIILSWMAPMASGTFANILYRITEPILGPLRRVIPRTGMFDFSPLVAIILLQLLVRLTYWLA